MGRQMIQQERNGQAQERRTAKAVLEGPEMVWRKNPQGWTVETASGGCYLVTERGCTCPDHQKHCAGGALLCKHRIALNHKLLAERAYTEGEKRGLSEKPLGGDGLTTPRKDVIFDSIFATREDEPAPTPAPTPARETRWARLSSDRRAQVMQELFG